MIFNSGTIQLLILLSAIAISSPAQAGLGQHIDSIEQDRQFIAGARKSTTEHHNYTVHEIAQNNVVIKEYVNNDGVVFGFAAKGNYAGMFTQVMGEYLPDYQQANAQNVKVRGQRSFSSVTSNSVVVRRFGHMRALRVSACVPSLLPSGIDCDAVE